MRSANGHKKSPPEDGLDLPGDPPLSAIIFALEAKIHKRTGVDPRVEPEDDVSSVDRYFTNLSPPDSGPHIQT
ncbi:hypothetical protein AGR3A_Cc260074 [Agrobacterium tomkonis CFBP 6623]|uniref:Uncharacterized protein n=1 Tax=Agrobacterium tomkonis CFBP 6623 TaxID=1183432 RepID=A0A1S7PHK8_9HYPH|nr:hypothetical protein AGR3A_Cc260074 [Agrobacterium tomkonis CFBP 6623]